MITFDDFKKIELKVGKVLSAERVEKSEKLLKLRVDLGECDVPGSSSTSSEQLSDIRQIIAGIGKWHEPEGLIGKNIIVVANLEPRMMMGFESQGMLLAVGGESPVLLMPEHEVPPGTGVH